MANVKITYSDAHITVDDRTVESDDYKIMIACGKHIRVGTTDSGTGDTDGDKYMAAKTAAVRIDATIQIVDHKGKLVDGSFIAACTGINVRKYGTKVTRPLYDGYLYDYYSESILVKNGNHSEIYVRPNNDEIEKKYGDNATGSILKRQLQWYYSLVEEKPEGIKFTGAGWLVPDEENTNTIAGGPNHQYSAGFVTTATDARNGIRFTSYSAGNRATIYDTFYMDGYSIWHRIRSSSTGGGTIETTKEGGSGGEILGPGTYVVPDGKTVTYRMAPDPGFVLDSVTVNGGTLSYNGGTVYQDGSEALRKVVNAETGEVLYYEYEFPANMLDEAIHVKWKRGEPVPLTVNKTTIGGDGTFTFRIKATGEKTDRKSYKRIANWMSTWAPTSSFAHLMSNAYPLTLGGVAYNNDVDLIHYSDDSVKMPLSATAMQEKEVESEDGETKTLYLLDSGYAVEIDGVSYPLYSDTDPATWADPDDETGVSEAAFWVYDPDDKIDVYSESFVIETSRYPESVDFTSPDVYEPPNDNTGVTQVGSTNEYEFTITTSGGSGSRVFDYVPFAYDYEIQELTPDGWVPASPTLVKGKLTSQNGAVASFLNRKLESLTIAKNVEGAMASRAKYFKFDITIETDLPEYVLSLDTSSLVTNPSQNSETIYPSEDMKNANTRDDMPTEGTEYTGQELKCDEDGKVSFTVYLQHGNRVTISNLPAGAHYTVTENPESYKPEYVITELDKSQSPPAEIRTPATGRSSGASTGQQSIEFMRETTVTFTNIRDGVVPTEVDVNERAALILILTSLGLVTILYFTRRRHRRT